MHEQNNIDTHYIQDIFTFGDKILVAPVTDHGARIKDVYLPAGKWFNYWTHEHFEGGRIYQVEAPLDSMPIFVKAGSVIPEAPLMQYVGEFDIDELIFQVYYSDYEVNSFYFEDHDDTFAYEQNIYLEKKYVVNGTAVSMTITQSIEGLFTPRYETYSLKIIGLPFIPRKVVVDGKEYHGDLSFDELKRVRINTGKNFKRIEIHA